MSPNLCPHCKQYRPDHHMVGPESIPERFRGFWIGRYEGERLCEVCAVLMKGRIMMDMVQQQTDNACDAVRIRWSNESSPPKPKPIRAAVRCKVCGREFTVRLHRGDMSTWICEDCCRRELKERVGV